MCVHNIENIMVNCQKCQFKLYIGIWNTYTKGTYLLQNLNYENMELYVQIDMKLKIWICVLIWQIGWFSWKQNVSNYLYITYIIFDDNVTLVYNKYPYYIMILFKQFYWLSCCHLTFRKIWYCLIKNRIDSLSLSLSIALCMTS